MVRAQSPQTQHGGSGTADRSSSSRRFRPRLELLEDRLPLGDTVLGLSVIALAGLGSSSLDTSLPPAGEHSDAWQNGLFSYWDETRSIIPFFISKNSRKTGAATQALGQGAV